MMGRNFYKILQKRRTIYGLDRNIEVSEDRIEEVIKDAVNFVPSAFNSQSSRVVVLFGDHHEKLWEIAKDKLSQITPEEQFKNSTEGKINSFKAGYGTVLFFEDQSIVEDLQSRFSLYKDNFPVWAEQTSGMLQYIVWSSLEIEGLGASLQHYNPLINEDVYKTWDIPSNWKFIAQMPFGNPTSTPDDKEFGPLDEKYKAFK
jgi:predicted oxidoreductase (fatty acid repression mutant protein)